MEKKIERRATCLICDAPIQQIMDRRAKVYCSNKCKHLAFRQRNPDSRKNPKEKRIPISEWNELQKKVQDLSKPNTEVKPVEQPKTHYVVDTRKPFMSEAIRKKLGL